MTSQTLTLTELAAYIGWNKRTLYRKIKNKQFPVDPIRGTKPQRWLVSAVDAWLSNGGSVEA